MSEIVNGRLVFLVAVGAFITGGVFAQQPPAPAFSRPPLAQKPYAELPLGAIKPSGWLEDELRRMAEGMTGHLDEWYPEVCGPRNAWLGGDGDTWERGPYWIDGLYPLAKLIGDRRLEAKAMKWIEWTLANQRSNGQIGPYETKKEDRTQPPPRGAQIHKPDDWWPRMVMLKILQQHYLATGDERVVACLMKYFRYQLEELPVRPLHDPANPKSGSWWAAQRGGDNLMVVLWLYNITGEKFLLELGERVSEQTIPVTEWFSPGTENKIRRRGDQGDALHCVNLAQMMKTPIIRWQQDPRTVHLEAIENAFADIRTFHSQPHGLYGGDEAMHGDAPDRGSELCSAVEMMFSLEKMFEITGNPIHGDRLERVALNALPTQCTDDHWGRQYFQQTNQVQCTFGDRDFFNDNGDRVVYGLLRGYPCCTCNLHQAWPKFAQHLWLASKDGGLATLSYAPSSVTAKVGQGSIVTLRMATGYPFQEQVAITVSAEQPVSFPLHLRIPAWAQGTELRVNEQTLDGPPSGTMHVVDRTWKDGDTVTLRFPMSVRSTTWFARSKAIERGPLVYALDIAEEWKEVEEPRPDNVSEPAPHRGYREVRPASPWNYALPGPVANQPQQNVRVEVAEEIADNPWNRESAPVKIFARGVRLPDWTMNRNSAAVPPLSPAETPKDAVVEEITLIPYGSSTLRIAAFPWVPGRHARAWRPEELKFARVKASHTFDGDTTDAIRMPHVPQNSADRSIPRWTSWPQTGEEQWVEIDLGSTQRIHRVGVYWYNDNGGVQLPGSWRLESSVNGDWKAIELPDADKYGTRPDTYNTITLTEPLKTRKLRIVVTPAHGQTCVGILAVNIDTVQE